MERVGEAEFSAWIIGQLSAGQKSLLAPNIFFRSIGKASCILDKGAGISRELPTTCEIVSISYTSASLCLFESRGRI